MCPEYDDKKKESSGRKVFYVDLGGKKFHMWGFSLDSSVREFSHEGNFLYGISYCHWCY